MYFEGRHLPTYGVFVQPSDLVVGQVYFSVSFLDDDSVLPELTPLVFIGRDLDSAEPGFYFQDPDSYLGGRRYEAIDSVAARDAPDDESAADESHCSFTVMGDAPSVRVCDYERALDQLLACSLRRQKWDGQARAIRPRQRS